jgi:predicted lipoprotein with Yx(FWY)xxD motif
MLSAISLALLSACGGSSSNDPASTPTTPTPETPVAGFPSQLTSPTNSIVNDSGSLLLSIAGLSLYTFDNDSENQSNCAHVEGDSTSCASMWPPLLVVDGAVESENFTFVTRDDNTIQWAYQGQPLYTYFQDSSLGDINGDGIGNVWHLARPKSVTTNSINGLTTYVGNETILSMTSSGGVLENIRLNKEGFTLYTFDNDPVNSSVCLDNCINVWPPLLADSGAKVMPPLSLISTESGDQQWAYKGKALYFFSGDTAAEQTTGDNVGTVWHTATLEPAIQRVSGDNMLLSATGEVNALALTPGSTDDFSVQSMDKDGFTLYTFDNDSVENSACVDNCLINWPAFVPNEMDEAIGEYTIFTREDGIQQWAYKGQPLYFFANDDVRGASNGDDIGGVWHIIEPELITSITTENNDLGEVLTVDGMVHVLTTDAQFASTIDELDMTGFALYTFDVDTSGVSNCIDNCLTVWPPLLATDADVAQAPFSIVDREDGFKQWAVNGMPLYFFTPDTSDTDTLGENVNTVWHVARPAPVKVDDHVTEGALLAAHGNVLDSQGKTSAQLTGLTLYTFDSDIIDSGVSTCFDSCAVTWPPLYATGEDEAFGDYTIISRTEADNSETFQWVYQGLPLYFFVGDSVVGDTNGDYPTWTIARP